MTRLALVSLLVFSCASACTMTAQPLHCDTPACDAATPVDGALDAGTDTGLTEDGCLRATVTGPWVLELADDVSVAYRARIAPLVGAQPFDLSLTMERYGDATYVGTFPLDAGADTNRSTCAHCVAAYTGTTLTRGYFVDRGTLVLAQDPFGLVLDATLTNVRLIEVTIGGDTLESTPVPGGRCIALEPTTVSQRFAPDGWTCDVARYGDGATCDCNCGVFDADCDGVRPPMGCAAGTICQTRIDGPRFETYCADTCSRAEGRGCDTGVCIVDGSGREYCDTTPSLRASTPLGAVCPDGSTYCAPVGSSFADGICDVFDHADHRCRATCTDDATCDTAALERCYHLFGDGSIGFCSLRYPTGWTCDGATYADGTTCDCGCGVHDPDCDTMGAPLRGCASGEVCTPSDICAPVPPNDTCATATPLVIGHVTGTTLGATNDYAAERDTGCTGVGEDGPDVLYSVDLTAGQTLTVRGVPASTDLSLYLLGPGAPSVCDATASHCVAGVETAGEGAAELLSYAATAAGTYYLVVDSFGATFAGAFTLDVTRSP